MSDRGTVIGATLDLHDLIGKSTPLHHWMLAAMAASPSEQQVERLTSLPAKSRSNVLDLSERNQIGPIAAHHLATLWPESPEGDRARLLHDKSSRRMAILLGELDEVAARLEDLEIRLVALKNGGIARGIHPCAGCCPMGDIDVLVDRTHFEEAHQVLLSCGFTLAARGTVERANLEEGILSGGTEYVKSTSGEEVWFELQWRPIAGRWIRPEQEPKGADLLARSVAIKGTAVRVLAPTDNMLQVCLHTAKHSFVRAPGLRLHTDVDRLATWTPPDWSALASLARSMHTTTAVFMSLALSKVLLEAPVPDDVLDDLAPPAWKRLVLTRWLRRAGIFEPDEVKFNRPEMMAFHALLYDDGRTFAASVLDSEPDKLGPRHLRSNLTTGARRVRDLATRYQR